MFSRICNLCHRTSSVQPVNLQRYYRKAFKRKSNVNPAIPQTPTPENVEGKSPIITCKRKELNLYEGQTYSKHVPIPLACKGWHHYKSKGDYFFIHPYAHILKEAEQADKEDTHDTFAQFNLDPQITEILERYSITKPLNIQKTGIPKILDGANTIIAAETGCGKTLTYLLPMIDEVLNWKKMEEKREYNSPLGLIITPTRELAFQIGLESKKLCQYLGIRTRVFTGGKTKKIFLDPPVEDVDIIVASFGVISKLTTNRVIKLNMVRHLVLDEADALFHDTFQEQLQVFLKRVPLGFQQNANYSGLPTGAQFTVVSATMPSRMATVLKNIIDVESLVPVSSDKLHHILVPQKFIRVGPDAKPLELLKYIKPKIAKREQVIVFSNKNSSCGWVSIFLNNSNIETAYLHGDLELYDKHKKYASFKSGKFRVLCTTNAGSRGLDTISVRHILNYDFPTTTSDYIHRCGRTGRIGNVKDCRVTSFISTPSDITVLQKIERAARWMKPIPIFSIHEEEKEDDEGFTIEDINQIKQEDFSIPY